MDSGPKTIAGFVACATASFFGAWLVAGCPVMVAAAVAAAAAIAEWVPSRLDDNVRVTAAAGVAAQLLA